MKKFLLTLLCLGLVGCASTQVIRKAQYLSDNYIDQVQKNIFVISLIDARTDKKKNLQKLLSNRNMVSYCILNPLKRKGYFPKFLDVDMSACGSLSGTNKINEIACLDNELFENGDLFLLLSIDQYSPPTGMGVNGLTKVTGFLYSKSRNSFIWKDSIEGNYDSINAIMFGPGGYVGKLILKSMGPDLTFRSNVFGSIRELLNSVPSFPNKRRETKGSDH